MKDLADMTVKEVCELARNNKIQFEMVVEPYEYGGTRTAITIQPWEKYEPFCPFGKEITYIKKSD